MLTEIEISKLPSFLLDVANLLGDTTLNKIFDIGYCELGHEDKTYPGLSLDFKTKDLRPDDVQTITVAVEEDIIAMGVFSVDGSISNLDKDLKDETPEGFVHMLHRLFITDDKKS